MKTSPSEKSNAIVFKITEKCYKETCVWFKRRKIKRRCFIIDEINNLINTLTPRQRMESLKQPDTRIYSERKEGAIKIETFKIIIPLEYRTQKQFNYALRLHKIRRNTWIMEKMYNFADCAKEFLDSKREEILGPYEY